MVYVKASFGRLILSKMRKLWKILKYVIHNIICKGEIANTFNRSYYKPWYRERNQLSRGKQMQPQENLHENTWCFQGKIGKQLQQEQPLRRKLHIISAGTPPSPKFRTTNPLRWARIFMKQKRERKERRDKPSITRNPSFRLCLRQVHARYFGGISGGVHPYCVLLWGQEIKHEPNLQLPTAVTTLKPVSVSVVKREIHRRLHQWWYRIQSWRWKHWMQERQQCCSIHRHYRGGSLVCASTTTSSVPQGREHGSKRYL